MPNNVTSDEQQVAERTAKRAQQTLKGRFIGKLDDFQQRHAWFSFPYSVQKKYGEDEAADEAALVTYYGFLSLFPLLVAALSLTQLSIFQHTQLKSKITTALSENFPIVGSQLQNNVQASQKAGIALIISLVLTLYGARGVATALQRAMNHIWQVPKFERGGIVATLKSFVIILLIGIGFIITGVLSSIAAAPNSNAALRIATIALSLLLIFPIIMLIFRLSISVKHKFKELFVGSIIATIGLQIVQAFGGFLITHELKKLSSIYGTFAVILALLFWIYLIARILLYSTEIDTVRSLKLYPRSLTKYRLTPQDQRALKLYAGRERYEEAPREEIGVSFKQV